MKEKFYVLIVLFVLAIFGWNCESKHPNEPDPVFDKDPTQITISDFESPEDCMGCHPNQYNEWKGSMMAYGALDPVFIESQKLGQEETNTLLDQFCVQCHSPIVSKLGLSPPNYTNDQLPPIGLRGVTCTACHYIEKVNEPKNAMFDFDPHSGMRGPIEDPVNSSFHKIVHSPLHGSSFLCSTCHNVVNARGVIIENTFFEWEDSPAAAGGKQCQDCHMPTYRGRAAINGPERDVHRHYFVGVDVALIPFPDRELQGQMVEELLRSAAEINVDIPDSTQKGALLPITVNLTSKTEGHYLPSGAIANRQMWIAVTVTDQSSGQIIYQSGHLDANFDLMDRHSDISPNADYDLTVFSQQMAGEGGHDVFFSWQAFSERTVTLKPLETVSPQYFVFLPPDINGPLIVDVKLRFRTFPPFLVRMLDLHDLSRNIPIVDMDEWSDEIIVK